MEHIINVLTPQELYEAKKRGIANGISKLWERQTMELGKYCPSMIDDNYSDAVEEIQSLAQKYKSIKVKGKKFIGISVAPPYLEPQFSARSFIEHCHKIKTKHIKHAIYSFEVGEEEGATNLHVHYLVEYDCYPSKIKDYFTNHFRQYLRNEHSIHYNHFPYWDCAYITKMYPNKEQLHLQYRLAPHYTLSKTTQNGDDRD